MQAVSFEQGEVSLREVPRPSPEQGEALVRVLLAGICGTDLELLQGYKVFSGRPGHEFVGQVERADGHSHLVGKRVVAGINIGCGSCSWCLRQEPRHCQKRQVLGIRDRHGAFAEYLCLPADTLHIVDEAVPDQEAVLAEPLAAALRVTQQIHLTSKVELAVLGDGSLGLLSALALSRLLTRVTLIGRHAGKLAIASRQGIFTCHLEPGSERGEVLGRTGRFDVVIEATGKPEGLDLALDMARPGGTVVLKTTSSQAACFDTSRIAVKEISLLGSRCGDLEQALLFLRNRWLDPTPLISAVFPLAEFPAALERARRPETLKVLLDCKPSA